jgi:hypothetical protein
VSGGQRRTIVARVALDGEQLRPTGGCGCVVSGGVRCGALHSRHPNCLIVLCIAVRTTAGSQTTVQEPRAVTQFLGDCARMHDCAAVLRCWPDWRPSAAGDPASPAAVIVGTFHIVLATTSQSQKEPSAPGTCLPPVLDGRTDFVFRRVLDRLPPRQGTASSAVLF